MKPILALLLLALLLLASTALAQSPAPTTGAAAGALAGTQHQPAATPVPLSPQQLQYFAQKAEYERQQQLAAAQAAQRRAELNAAVDAAMREQAIRQQVERSLDDAYDIVAARQRLIERGHEAADRLRLDDIAEQLRQQNQVRARR